MSDADDTVDVAMSHDLWHRIFDSLIAGEAVRGFALVENADGSLAIALHITGPEEQFIPLATPAH